MSSRPVNSAGLIVEKVKIVSVVFILLSNLKGRNDDDINYREGTLSFSIVYLLRFYPKFYLRVRNYGSRRHA